MIPNKTKTTSAKPGHVVGVEFDHLAIRAARLATDGRGGHVVESLVDVTGNFAEDGELIDGLRQVKDRLRIGVREPVATCVSGKQVSVSQIAFRKLPPEEMESALRLEMRKSIPFEIAGATLDYQVLGEENSQSDSVQVLVAIAASGMLGRQLKVMEKAGFNPSSVDVLPVAASNALWSWVGLPKNDNPFLAVHVGPQISTIVVDGARSPFFNRYVYFAAEDFAAADPASVELERRVRSLAEEIARSISFYEKSTSASGFQQVMLLGEFLDTPNLANQIRHLTGLPAHKMDLPRRLGYSHDNPQGRFDLALALALRAGED